MDALQVVFTKFKFLVIFIHTKKQNTPIASAWLFERNDTCGSDSNAERKKTINTFYYHKFLLCMNGKLFLLIFENRMFMHQRYSYETNRVSLLNFRSRPLSKCSF